MINKRIFGSDLPIKVKKKLEARQFLAEKARPGESIKSKYPDDNPTSGNYPYSEFIDNEFENQADLSSRTPFVRMWVGVEIFKSTTEGTEDDVAQESSEKIKKEPISKRIYVIGNHDLNQGSTNPNESVGTSEGQSGDTELMHGLKNDDVIPPEFGTNDNQYLKPPAGITSFSSTTEGTLGVMRKTTVGFTVHNFHDFDKIYQRYFLRPGAQIFVDFGWNTGVLYNPKTLVFDKKKDEIEASVEELLYGETDKGDKVNGYVTEAQGDLDTLFGYVTNFDAKILENGSVECSVEITSKNIAILSERFDNDVTGQQLKSRLKYTLDTEIESIGLALLTEPDSQARKYLLDQMKGITVRNKGDYDIRQRESVKDKLDFTELKLTVDNIATGVGIDTRSNDTYISWGFFEDVILNPEFGFGEDRDTIQKGTDTEVRIDSSESFTSYNDNLVYRQGVIGGLKKTKLEFLYPHLWDESFNSKVKKVPLDYSTDIIKKTQHDKRLGRIPLREVFVNTSTIKSAISNSKNLVAFIKNILTKINTDSGEMFDWGISNNGSDNLISIIDRNFLGIERDINDTTRIFDKLFKFNVMSPNSIVKGYDLSFNMPEGGIATMLAIQGMSSDRNSDTGNSIFPVNSLLDTTTALNILFDLSKKPRGEQEEALYNTIGVGYYPSMGSYQGNKLGDDIATETKVSYAYDRVSDLLTHNPDLGGNVKYTGVDPDLSTLVEFKPNVTAKTSNLTEEEATNKMEANINFQRLQNIEVVTSVSDYYLYEVKKTFFTQKRSTPLPLTLSLSIYGISSIQPGDIFRVDYLPASYSEMVYFQVMKVTQAIDSTGWYTTLETQYRIRATDKKEATEVGLRERKVALDPSSLMTDLPLATSTTNVDTKSTPEIKTPKEISINKNISELAPYVYELKPYAVDKRFDSFVGAYTFIHRSEVTQSETKLKDYLLPYVIYNKTKYKNSTHTYKKLKPILFDQHLFDIYIKYFPPTIESTRSVRYETKNQTTGFIPNITIKLKDAIEYFLLIGKTGQWVVVEKATLEDDLLNILTILLSGNLDAYKPKKYIEKCDECNKRYHGWDKQPGYPKYLHNYTKAEQKKICEKTIGLDKYCVWSDTWGDDNDCQPIANACWE